MKNIKFAPSLCAMLGVVFLSTSASTSNATILTFRTGNAKVPVYTSMNAIQNYGSNVIAGSVVSGIYTYYYEMGNDWTPDVTVRYSTESPDDFPEYFGDSDGDNVWPGVLFLWSHLFSGGTSIPASIPTGYEYYVTFTSSAANQGVVLNSFVLNDYVGYTAEGSPPQEVQWRVARGTPSGAILASGSATLQDGEVSTITTGMSASQAGSQSLVLVIKRMGGTEDDLAADDIDFDQVPITAPFRITNIARNPANGQLTLSWTSSPGKTYRLNYSTDLADFGGAISNNIPSGGSSTTYGPFALPAGPFTRAFFRVTEN